MVRRKLAYSHSVLRNGVNSDFLAKFQVLIPLALPMTIYPPLEEFFARNFSKLFYTTYFHWT